MHAAAFRASFSLRLRTDTDPTLKSDIHQQTQLLPNRFPKLLVPLALIGRARLDTDGYGCSTGGSRSLGLLD